VPVGTIGTYLHAANAQNDLGKMGALVAMETPVESYAAAVEWNAAQVDQHFVIRIGAQQCIAHSSATKTTFQCREMVSYRPMICVHRDKLKTLSRQLATHVVGMRPENLDDFLSQQFVFDGAKTVAQVVNEAASEAQGPIKITGFVRCECSSSPQPTYPYGLSSSKMVLVYCV
jgi:translation elongation factor EF-Ts